MKYFYVTYQVCTPKAGGTEFGAICLVFTIDFDLEQAHEAIRLQLGELAVVQDWKLITEAQFTQYSKFVARVRQPGPMLKPKAQVLSLITGGKAE